MLIMTKFDYMNCKIDGLKVITPFYMEDERGYFLKCYEKDIFNEFGIDSVINEDFETCSKRNVIRGLHFQIKEPQGKLVRVISGAIKDIAVDLRKNSLTFGEWESVLLTGDNHQAFWIPAGFAHGFEVLSDNAIVSYKCVGKFQKEYDTGINAFDEKLNIVWETTDPVLSAKDKALMSFRQFEELYSGL